LVLFTTRIRVRWSIKNVNYNKSTLVDHVGRFS